MATADTARLLTEMVFSDKGFSRGISRAIDQTGKLDKGMGRVGKGAGQLSSGFARAGTLIGAAAIGGIGAAAKSFIDFESSFAGVRKTVDASEGQFLSLEKEIRRMATTIPIAATELAHLGEIGGQLGIDVESLDEFIDVTAKLGVATDLTAEDAADALGRLGNILELTADDYDNLGSAVVRLGNKGAAGEAEIFELTKRFAAQGKQAGLTTQEILGLAEATASFTGLKEEAAGTAVSGLLSTLTKISAGAGRKGIKTLEQLNELVGTDFKKAFEKDASDALVLFLKQLGKLDKFEQARVLKNLGLDAGRMRQLITGLSANVEDVGKSFETANEGWAGNFLNEEAAKRFDTLASKITVLKQNLVEAGINIGEGMAPAIERATEKLTEFLKVPKNVADLKQLGKDIGAAIDSIDWTEVLNGAKSMVPILKGALTWAKRLFDVFNALPTEIKAAVASLLVLNKLSGGLIGGGIGNIFGGIAETVTRNLGSKIPGIGKAFVQPVFVTNMPVGGLGGAPLPAVGGLTTAITGLGAAVLGGLVITAIAPIALTALTTAIINATGKTVPEREVEGRRTTAEARGVPVQNRPTKPGRVPMQGLQGDWLADWMKRQKKLITGGAPGAFRPPPRTAGDRPSPGNPGEFKKNLDKIGFDKWVTKAQDIKNAVTTSGSEQKAELGNIKNATATLDSNTKTGLSNVKNATNTQGTLQAGRDALNTTVTAVGALNTASATRNVSPPIVGALNVGFAGLSATIWAARPVIPATTVVQNYTVSQRGGSTSDSRTRSGQ